MSVKSTLKKLGGCAGGVVLFKAAKLSAEAANLGRDKKKFKPETKRRMQKLFPYLNLDKVRFVINAELPANWIESPDTTDAMTFGYTIYFKGKDIQWTYNGLSILIHELVHVDQVRRMGDSENNFACKYGEGYITAGWDYYKIPLEKEAYGFVDRLIPSEGQTYQGTTFDPDYYATQYPDLMNAFNHDKYKLFTHWLDFGIDEGRQSSKVFDVNFYLNLHPDLLSTFGEKNYKAALDHWLHNGIKEGRIGSFAFDVKFYLDFYGDLQAAFGTNYEAIIRHWLEYGIKEGRISSPAFDTQYYLNQNIDIKNSYGSNNYSAAVDHWLRQGLNEGRVSSAAFDVKFYLEHHDDLRTTFGDTNYLAALRHWLQFGINEGRWSAPGFNVKYYLESNPDLQAAFNSNYMLAIKHWLQFGISEGRKGIPS